MAIFGTPDSGNNRTAPATDGFSFKTEQLTPDFRLTNARQNEPYSAVLSFDSDSFPIEIIDVDVTSCSGLRFDITTLKIEGKPTENGDFELVVTYQDQVLNHEDDGQQITIEDEGNESELLKTEEEHKLIVSQAVKTAKVNLYVNPDPKSLWLNIASNPADDYYKPDTETKLFTVSAADKKLNTVKTMLSARIRGRSHAHNGTCCDDDFFINRLQNQWHIVVVADGAGSALYSRKGSALATYEAGCALTDKLEKSSFSNRLEMVISNFIKNLSSNTNLDEGKSSANALYWHSKEFETDLSKDSLDDAKLSGKITLEHHLLLDEVVELVGGAAKSALESHNKFIATPEAKINNITLQDLSTTLMIVITKYIEGKWFIASFCIGDGVIGVLNEGQGVQVLSSQDGGEFAGQTHFLTEEQISPEYLRVRCQYLFIENYTAILAMTDGVSDPFFETDNMIYDSLKWDELWQAITSEVINQEDKEFALAKYLNFWSKGHHDDRTLALLY